MSKLRHSASAESDLLEAWLFVAEDSVEADGITVARVLHHARDVPAIWNWPRH
ncbi:hypothetical protein [Thauera phenylacetica]|uniref:hypothetical protein n=1 Tax=Thauera phenylacetica TaxID=164400 RepID=UPI0012FBAAE3|nr:hypothetical protein [Thauera phenylacetica]